VSRALLLGLLLLAAAQPAAAHLLNMTRVQVRVDAAGAVEVQLQIDLNRPAGGAEAYFRLSRIAEPLHDPAFVRIADDLVRAVQIDYGGVRVPLSLADAKLPQEPHETFLDPVSWPMTLITLRGALPAAPSTAVAVLQARMDSKFRFEEPIAVTFLRVPEQRSLTRWLVADQASPRFDPAAEPKAVVADSTPWWRYVAFGFTHIVPKGLDHVLFVLGLYFGARRLSALFWLVTGFTLAHSATLGLASAGVLRLPPRIVETLIALSIAWIGIENLVPRLRDGRHRYALVFCFGLLHGMGFASALGSLQTPQGSFLLALLGFNLGIEAGQAVVIGGAALLTLWWADSPHYERRVVRPASLAIALGGLAWTAERILRGAGSQGLL
jgi:hypothetical protein